MPDGKLSTDMKDPQTRVRALAMVGSTVAVDPCVPIHRYFRSGKEMLRMAKMYLDEAQLENAFILYSKYITLFVEKIPKHPDYQSVSIVDKASTKKNLDVVFPIAEKVKASVLEQYSRDYNKWLEEKKKQEAEEELNRLRCLQEEEQQLKELRLREEFEKEKLWRLAQGREQMKGDLEFPDSLSFDSIILNDSDSRSASRSSKISAISPLPSISSEQSIPFADNQSMSDIPSVDRSTKPRSLLSPGPESEYVHGLRLVIIPASGIDRFLQLAWPNTEKSTETCGILAGKMSHNQLVITHLLIPKQSGTSDSCTTDNEEDIFMYQDKYDLITLGWIHTHPSQTAFMSSVDLHTHCSYQLMMPEAIAIVCSPKYKETSIFSLTPDYGLDYIAQCREKGFHPHPNDPIIYEESIHVKLDPHISISVVDLRK